MPSLYMGGKGSWIEVARGRFLEKIPSLEIMESRGDLPFSLDDDLLAMASAAMLGVAVGQVNSLQIFTLASDAMRTGKPFVIWIKHGEGITIPDLIRHSQRVHILDDLQEAIETTVYVVQAFA